jgi:hypothetical protein
VRQSQGATARHVALILEHLPKPHPSAIIAG